MTREEAIEVYNGLINEKIKEAFEFFAPEFAESKDERIRKGLIEALKTSKTVGELKFILPEPTKEECLNWLEKQKDASYAIEAVERIDKYIDEHLANAHDMKDSNPDKKYYRGWDDALGKMAGILQDVYSGEKQKERGPLTKEEEYILHRIIEYLEDETCPSEWISLLQDIYCLPYEKQKEQKPWKVGANAYFTPEQKPVEYLDKDKVYAIMKKLHELAFSQLIPINSEEYKKINEITTDVRDLLDYPIEQKPAEWDDYTKTNLGRAIQIIKNAKGNLQGYQTDDGIYECDKAIECLEHFLYRGLEIEKPAEWSDTNELVFQDICKHLKEEGYGGWVVLLNALHNGEFQLKQEWSEEDEKNLELVTDCVYEFYPDPVMKYKLKDWLKSLRPSWKPSEEQMEALRRAVNKLANTDVADSVRLSIMYDNLKKLM